MNQSNIRDIYMKYLVKQEDFGTERLDQCIRFHIYQEAKKRISTDPKFSKLADLVEEQQCPEQDTSLCKYADILHSYAMTVITDFEKGELEDLR